MEAAHHKFRWNLSQRHDKNCNLYFKQKPNGASLPIAIRKRNGNIYIYVRSESTKQKLMTEDGRKNRDESFLRKPTILVVTSTLAGKRAGVVLYITYHYRNEREVVSALKVILFLTRNPQSAGLSPLLALSWNNGDIISRVRPIKWSSLFMCSNTHGWITGGASILLQGGAGGGACAPDRRIQRALLKNKSRSCFNVASTWENRR